MLTSKGVKPPCRNDFSLASEYAGNMRDEKAVGVLAGAVDGTREECGCYKNHIDIAGGWVAYRNCDQ